MQRCDLGEKQTVGAVEERKLWLWRRAREKGTH